MKEPTQEQIKKFWVWCGFRVVKSGTGKSLGYIYDIPVIDQRETWVYSNADEQEDPPEIDLNNLFKYAVPKIKQYNLTVFPDDVWAWHIVSEYGNVIFESLHTDPALALFWAIWEVMDE